ncbi:hypothetical protein [Streptomyces sp. S186]|uniref:hypothetical protein n=1 Tax=Streptomyces sp. S186 TaxID=3434395 RepID=UPI003F677908
MAIIMEWFRSIKLPNWLTVPVLTITMLLMTACALGIFLDKRSEYASRYARRSDLVFVKLFTLVANFDSRAGDWTDRTITKRLRYSLISTASEVEMSRMRLTRTLWGERALRRKIRTENKRIGAALRAHADALALAGTQTDFERIRDSLYGALECAAVDDWNSLIGSTPEVSHLPYWAAFLLRLIPGLTVAGVALSLPLMPGLADSAHQIRNYLLPIAAIMLIGANETVLGSVRAVLDKVAFAGSGK